MAAVKARILLWGIAGSGKSTTLATISAKLRPDLRGELRRVPTALDPTVYFETLPILLGPIGGVDSQIEIVALPGAEDQAMTRKQLLDAVDGLILVLDCSPERIEANWNAIAELRASLADYGQRLEDLPIVFQYNKRDRADPFAIEDLHRRVGIPQAAVFETIATTGHGVLAALTTLSKHVVRALRGQSPAPGGPVSTVESRDELRPDHENASSHEILEAAILAEGQNVEHSADAEPIDFDFSLPGTRTQPDWNAIADDPAKPEAVLGHDLRIVSLGQASLDAGGRVRIPLVLGDESGLTRSVVLRLHLESLLEDGGD